MLFNLMKDTTSLSSSGYRLIQKKRRPVVKSDSFNTDSQTINTRRVSRTTRGGRRPTYVVDTVSFGSNQWTNYVYFCKSSSVRKFDAIQKTRDLSKRGLRFLNYFVVPKSTGLDLLPTKSTYRFKSVSMEMFLTPKISKYPLFKCAFRPRLVMSGIVPANSKYSVGSKIRGSKNKTSSIRLIKKILRELG